MTPEEFNALPPAMKRALERAIDKTSIINSLPVAGVKPATAAGATHLLGETTATNIADGPKGATLQPGGSRDSYVLYNETDTTPNITRAHEMEHVLANQGLGSSSVLNTQWDNLVGDEGAKRAKIVQRLINHAPYLQKQWGLPSVDAANGYFSEKVLDRPDAHNFLYEQMATLSALEQAKGKRLTDDPYVRKNILQTPAERETFNALTGLRQSRLDSKDIPPYTRQEDVVSDPSTPTYLKQLVGLGGPNEPSAGTRIKQMLGFAGGGFIDSPLPGGKKIL